ncbi:Hemicentin-1 [Desmophyllum pertusum]|uniref:Hemicentin-1 n=1 Tax=Desmophyllum pertusum TaxID=174260 RepID=A0A9W9YVY5_9CNID|nr:Hemicentin-1 [Desmophyllum pertusum]
MRGLQGLRGETGSTGSPGNRGIAGPMGRPGEKGSIGVKGNKGSKGFMGLQGPKGEIIFSPKISVLPESQEVFVKKSATFHCWVQGPASKKITWRKLGGALFNDTAVEGGTAVLHINHVQRSDVGSYMCTAYTAHGILRTVSSLQVKEPPVFTNKPPSQFVVVRATTLSICCEAAGSPHPRIDWSRGQQSSNSTLVF